MFAARLAALLRPAVLAAAGAVLLASVPLDVAHAQSAACRQIEAELASLSRPGASDAGAYSRQSARARQRLGQVQGTMASLGCERGFVLFGPQPPAQCGALRAEASNLRAVIAQYDGAARQASAGNPQRRAQLIAALDANNCRGARRAPAQEMAAAPPPQPRQRGFFEMLFGGGGPTYATETHPQAAVDPEADPSKQVIATPKKVVGGGPLAVCVRTCDGYFFPVNYQGSDGEYEEICRASCPATEAKLFWMQAGGDLDTAKTEDGQRYTALPNAFQYRKAFDPGCSCKAQGQSWASALREADGLVSDRRSDITVTEERSLQMSRPQAVGLRGTKKGKAQDKAAEADDATLKLDTNFATNSTASAGIGPAASSGRTLGTEDGETREVNGRSGEKKQVRMLTPTLSTAQ
jgi:hypothetical protein